MSNQMLPCISRPFCIALQWEAGDMWIIGMAHSNMHRALDGEHNEAQQPIQRFVANRVEAVWYQGG